jgi:hypothetical protein
MVLVFAALAASGLLQVLGVVAFRAVRPNGNVYAAIVGVSLVTTPLTWWAGASLFQPALSVDGRVFFGLAHLMLGALLFHFMTLPDRSVTLRVLVELLVAADGTLSLDDLAARYSVRDMVESRVRQLRDGGFLDLDASGDIRLRPRGLAFGRFVTAGRALFRIESAN